MQTLKRVKEISNLARGSKAWCRASARSSYAASVPCDAPEVKKKKTGKRLPIAERHAMVESFVNRYRGDNSGKFPTVSHAMKEVGGSYYVVKKIMQELEYNSKLPSSNARKEVPSKTEVRNSYLSSGLKSNADEIKPSPEISIPKKPEDVNDEEHYKIQLDIDGLKSKSEVRQPLFEVSCLENPKVVAEQKICGSVLEIDGSESKIDKYQPSPEYLLLKKAENTREEEPNQCIQQPLLDVSCAKKSEDAKEQTHCESVPDVDSLESKNEEHQLSHDYSIPKIPENSKEEHQPSPDYLLPKKAENTREEELNQCIQQPVLDVSYAKKSKDAKKETHCESVPDVNSSERKNGELQPSHEYSIPKIPENSKEEHRKSVGELSEKHMAEKIQTKSSIWGTLKSAAEDFINIWRKR